MKFNNNGVNLIHNPKEWAEYCRLFQAANHITSDVAWGKGPSQFPVLVASIIDTPRVISCYIYKEQAIALLTAANYAGTTGDLAGTTDLPVLEADEELPLIAGDQELATTLANGNTEKQHTFNKQIAAVQLSIVQTLIEARLCTEEKFEKRVAANTAVVDRWATEDQDKLRKVVDGVSVLDTLLGRKPNA